MAETEQFSVTLNVDAASLYGVQYQLSYDANMLTLDGVTDGSFRGTGQCTTQTGTPGEVTVFCTRHEPDENANGTPITISELTFTPNAAGLTGSGPWSQHFDLQSSESQLLSGARGGVNVYINNGGFGEPSRTITGSGAHSDVTGDGEINLISWGATTSELAARGHRDVLRIGYCVWRMTHDVLWIASYK